LFLVGNVQKLKRIGKIVLLAASPSIINVSSTNFDHIRIIWGKKSPQLYSQRENSYRISLALQLFWLRRTHVNLWENS